MDVCVYESYEQMLVLELDIDIVDVCMLFYVYVEISINVFNVGCYVLCEKLMVVLLEECDVMIVV